MTATVEHTTTARLLERLRDAVGAEHVLTGAGLRDYDDPYSFLEEQDQPRPAAAVRPASVEQVQAVVAIATAEGIPLWTVSRGRNFAYGGAAARVPGSVVVDLHRMDRVLEVDEELGYVVVEPGVSFLDLHAELVARGSALMMSVPDIGWGSVLGNALERGLGYAAHGDHSAHICGLEVVLADGTVLRTGLGATDGGVSRSVYRGGFGPSLDGLFLQSNLGVVTRMGLWLAPRPATTVVCEVQGSTDDSLATLVDTLRPLQLDATIQSTVMIGSAAIVAVIATDRAAWHTGPGAMPPEAHQAVRNALHVGHWNARFALYGPASLTSARLDVVRAAVAGHPELSLTTRSYAGDVAAADVAPPDRAQVGIPSTDLARMAAWRGGTPAHTDVSLVGPSRGVDVLRQRDLLRAGVERHGFDYAGGFAMYGRHTMALAVVSFDRDDAEQRAQVRALVPAVVAAGREAGYSPYRAHTAYMDLVAAGNDPAVTRTLETLKDALDPAGVLAAGKQGVWPGRSAARR